jgi:urease accessory protein
MLIVTQRLSATDQAGMDIVMPDLTLALSAEERCRSRHRWPTEAGVDVLLRLPRGTVLQTGDLLGTDPSQSPVTWVRVMAKPEPVLTAYPHQPQDLVRAAYHLGNRHIPLEIGSDYLRLSPDPVLAELLLHLGFQVTPEVTAFFPEGGAYHGTAQGPSHGQGPNHDHPQPQQQSHPHSHEHHHCH